MSVGVLLITHSNIGMSLLEVSRQILRGPPPLPLKILSIEPEMKVEWIRHALHHMCNELNQGDGVLILTDLYGSTPCNEACRLKADYQVYTVAGLNLSMLLKVMNYSKLDLEHLAQKASDGAHQGVIKFTSSDCSPL